MGELSQNTASEIQAMREELAQLREMKMGLCGLSTKETWSKVQEAVGLRVHLNELMSLTPDDDTVFSGIERLKSENEAMLEAIREVHKAVSRLLDNGHHDACALLNFANKNCDCGHLRTETALETLKPFLP